MVVPGGWGVAGVEGKGGAYHGCGWGWMWPNGESLWSENERGHRGTHAASFGNF